MSEALQVRVRTPMVLILYAIYQYYRTKSLRTAAESLSKYVEMSHVAIWKWVQKYGNILGLASRPKRREVKAFFVDENFVQLGNVKVAVWVAYDPTIKAVLGFHVSREPNSVDAYLFLLKLIITYGKRPIYTDSAKWYNDACRWLGLYHEVYDMHGKALIERINGYIKGNTRAFDHYFPLRSEFRSGLGHIKSWFGCFFLFLDSFRPLSRRIDTCRLRLP